MQNRSFPGTLLFHFPICFFLHHLICFCNTQHTIYYHYKCSCCFIDSVTKPSVFQIKTKYVKNSMDIYSATIFKMKAVVNLSLISCLSESPLCTLYCRTLLKICLLFHCNWFLCCKCIEKRFPAMGKILAEAVIHP